MCKHWNEEEVIEKILSRFNGILFEYFLEPEPLEPLLWAFRAITLILADFEVAVRGAI